MKKLILLLLILIPTNVNAQDTWWSGGYVSSTITITECIVDTVNNQLILTYRESRPHIGCLILSCTQTEEIRIWKIVDGVIADESEEECRFCGWRQKK